MQASWREGLVPAYWWVGLGLSPLVGRGMSSDVSRGGFRLRKRKITPFRFLLGHTLWVLLSFLLLQYWGLHTGDPAKEQQKKSKLIKSLCVCVL